MAKLRMTAKTSFLATTKPTPLPDDFKISDFTECSLVDAAELMVAAYRGTIDWEDGDDAAVAHQELENTLSGHYGKFQSAASLVVRNSSDTPISVIVSSLEGETPLILFLYTDPAYKGRGLASTLIQRSAVQLQKLGYERLALYVTEGNPAQELYEKLGFSVDPH